MKEIHYRSYQSASNGEILICVETTYWTWWDEKEHKACLRDIAKWTTEQRKLGRIVIERKVD